MSKILPDIPKGDLVALRRVLQKLSSVKLGSGASPTFAGLTLTGLTASRLIATDANDLLVSTDLVSWVTGTANQITVVDDADGTITLSIPDPFAVPGKVTAGSFASPLDVTNTREYGFELHYSGNNYNATAIRARAHAVTTDTSAQFQGGLFQAANNDNINVGCLNGLVAEAIGKATTNAATITMMRGALVGAEWSAKDTVTDLRTLHVRTHTRDAATEGYVSNTGYGIMIENEAVGGNGQALDAGIFFKGTNLSAGNKAFTYGIDFSGGTYGTADIKVTEGGIIGGAGADLRVNSNNQVIVNKTSATYPFLINSTDCSDQIGIYHDNTDAYFKWTDGWLYMETDEGTNSGTVVAIRGKGTGTGSFRGYDQNNLEWINFSSSNGTALVRSEGTSPVALSLQNAAEVPILMFRNAVEGDTEELQIWGRRTGDSLRSLYIGVGVDAADTASFDGLSNYLFGGNLVTLNDAHEDTDGGGETSWTGKRQDGAGTETSAGRIEISHDGVVANNQLGKMQLSVNTGAALVDVLEIDSSGNTKIGDAGTTNYLNIDSGGRLLLVGTAQTWEDIRIVPGAFQFPGVADPTLQSWQPGGAGATYKVYKFLKNDEVHFTCQVPHNYKEGSDLKPHLHWTPCDRGNEEDGNTVGWKIDYSWANTNAAFASSTTVDLSNACSGTDDQHELTDSGTITGTNKTISSILQIRLYRSDTGADDTWVGATAALSPAILEFDLHYEIDSLGSDLELVKDAP